MLTIRDPQMHVFVEARLHKFVEEALSIVKRHWAQRVELFGEPETRKVIRRSAEQGLNFGLDTEQQLLRYVNASMALGEGFSRRLPWAGRILGDARLSGETKIVLLMEKVAAFLDGEEVE